MSTITAPEQPAQRVARAAVMRAIWQLPRADQLHVYHALVEHLDAESDAPVPRISKEVQAREQTLAAVRTVAEHLGLTDRAPILAEFEQVSAKLGLGVTKTNVIKAWGRWLFAQQALLGINERISPSQRELARKTSGRKRTSEQFIEGVREWLATQPASTRMPDYDYYVGYANDAGRELPLVKALSVTMGLNLSWDSVLRVGDGHADLAEEYQRCQQQVLDREDPLGLVTVPETSLLLGIHKSDGNNLLRTPDAPVVIAVIGGSNVFYKRDVLAYRDRQPIPERTPGEVQQLIFDATQIAGLLGIKTTSLPSYIHARMFHRVPEPHGKVSNRLYWMRDRVREWAAEYRPELIEAGRA